MVHTKQVWLCFDRGKFRGVAPKVIKDYVGEDERWVSRNVTREQLEYIVDGDVSLEEWERVEGFYKGE